jgi:RHS repeat-associated protein
MDENANIFSYEEYYPFGSTSYQALNTNFNPIAKRYRYTGKERDEESGLYYHGARYYAPWLCRWTAADPIGVKDGINIYIYCKANSIVSFDPSGQQELSVCRIDPDHPSCVICEPVKKKEEIVEVVARGKPRHKSRLSHPSPVNANMAHGEGTHSSASLDHVDKDKAADGPSLVRATGVSAYQLSVPRTIKVPVQEPRPGSVVMDTINAGKKGDLPLTIKGSILKNGKEIPSGSSFEVHPAHPGKVGSEPHFHAEGAFKSLEGAAKTGMHGVPSSAFKILKGIETSGKVAGPVAALLSGYRVGNDAANAYEEYGGGSEGVAMGLNAGIRATASEANGWMGGALGAEKGGEFGATIGFMLGGPIGMAVGAGIGLLGGGILGYMAASKATEAIIDTVN